MTLTGKRPPNHDPELQLTVVQDTKASMVQNTKSPISYTVRLNSFSGKLLPHQPTNKKQKQKQKSSKHWTRQKQMSGLVLHLIFCRFSPFNCCLGVVLSLDKGNYPENWHSVFCPSSSSSSNNIQDKCLIITDIYGVWENGCVAGITQKRSFELFICLDLVLERLQPFLFQFLCPFRQCHGRVKGSDQRVKSKS